MGQQCSFIVNHSDDCKLWANIGTVKASGNCSVNVAYSFMHPTPVVGINYSQLEEKDYNGKTIFSSVASILNESENTSVFKFLNPVYDGYLNIFSDQNLEVRVYNCYGKIIIAKSLIKGSQIIDLSNFSKGYYYLKANNQTVPFVIM